MQAQLHLNALNWDRYKILVAKGVFSRQQGDQQEANFRVAEANVHAAENTIQANRDNLERLVVLQQYERVTAPFNGVITARNIDVGALISAQGSGLGTNPSPSSPGTTLAAAQGTIRVLRQSFCVGNALDWWRAGRRDVRHRRG